MNAASLCRYKRPMQRATTQSGQPCSQNRTIKIEDREAQSAITSLLLASRAQASPLLESILGLKPFHLLTFFFFFLDIFPQGERTLERGVAGR